jgi:hypothetical protein
MDHRLPGGFKIGASQDRDLLSLSQRRDQSFERGDRSRESLRTIGLDWTRRHEAEHLR